MNPELMHQWDAAIARQERDAARAEVARLRVEVEALREDAERYRWLREQHTYDGEGDEPGIMRWFVQAGRDPVPCDPGMLDSAIDAARKEAK